MNTFPEIWCAGDPHGDFRKVTRLAYERKPDAIIFLGDLECQAPLEEILYPILRSGRTQVRFIHGNHDLDTEDNKRFLMDGLLGSTLNLDGRVEDICGVRIAGLGGVFRGRVWSPPDPPEFESYGDLDRSLTKFWWNEKQKSQHAGAVAQKRLTHLATIFPDVYERLTKFEADILVTHEAPGGDVFHPYGFRAITDLAELLGASRAFHGHHHESRAYPKVAGCAWTSVGLREIVDLEGRRIE